MSMSFLLELREAAKHTRNVLTRKLLKDAADELATVIQDFAADPSTIAMQRLNCTWAKASRVYNTVRMSTPPTPHSGGLTEGALLQRAA